MRGVIEKKPPIVEHFYDEVSHGLNVILATGNTWADRHYRCAVVLRDYVNKCKRKEKKQYAKR